MCACRGTAGFAHVSCLAEQAKILIEEVEENNLGYKRWNERWGRWSTCSLCEQEYHGVVACALGWACWKTYVGRHGAQKLAISVLATGLYEAGRHEESLSVGEAELSMLRRLGASKESMLATQSNNANTYQLLGRLEDALRMQKDVYSGYLKLNGAEYGDTLVAAYNYALSLAELQRFEEAKTLLRKTMPVARRVLSESNDTTLRMRWVYAKALYLDPAATLDDIREAVTTLEEIEQTARRVLGGAHPTVAQVEGSLQYARDTLCDREMQSAAPPSSPEDELDEQDDATV